MPGVKKQKSAVGGSAAERGLDFQARVSAIVMVHLVAERPMGWLEGVLDDTPVELDAETGGPGDDVRFLTSGGKRVELQAKRGLQRGNDLWEALLSLADGVGAGQIDAGILAVCPNSSGTIREALSEDIIRLGNGRFDGLREIGSNFSSRLTTASLNASVVCSRIRIVVVSAVEGNREAEATASERLGRVTHDPQPAWQALVKYGRQLIRIRGKATPDQIYRELSLAGVALKMSGIETRVQLQAAIRDWLHATYAEITILGVSGRVSFEKCWLSLDAHLLEGGPTAHAELDKALKHYHDYSYQRRTSEQAFDSHTIGRFINKCVVLGGPGIGKSTLLKKLAIEYSRDGYLTLLVRLPQVAALITREGCRFEDILMNIALSGSGLGTPSISMDGAVVLCDGLDECGSQQPLVTAALHAFSIAHPNTRIVVSSRPIGYRAGEIADWRHYELQPLKDTEAEEAISRVLWAIPFPSQPLRDKAIALAKEQFRTRSIKGAASRSPLMLTLMAALSAKGIDPGSGKAALYRQLFQLIEDHPPARLTEKPPSEPERSRFLDLLGWSLLAYGNEPADQALKRCSQWWSEEMGTTSLASEAKVRACCDYWECLGVVERVRTMTQEAITFVHKTFGEFAAARYISQCKGDNQRALVARAIQTPEWKEALSFASHLGLASLILEVWAELATDGDSKAGYRLDDAMELVVQSGVPITESAIEGFAACCWKVVGNSASRTRYAAGEALCIVSKEHWSVVRLDTLKRLVDPDNWSKLVAWACLSVSPEKDIPFSELVDILRGLGDLLPSDSHLGGLWLAPTINPVRQHLILGAARRILLKGHDPDGLNVLKSLLAQAGSMSISAIHDLSSLFKEFGVEPPLVLDNKWTKKVEWLVPPREVWNREVAHFLEIVDDPSVSVDTGVDGGLAQSWELGALLTASGFWQMSAGESINMTPGKDAMLLRRMVMHGIMNAAGLDRKRLVQQARFCRGEILNGDSDERLTFFDLPRVDVNAQFEDPTVGVETIGELEQVILGGGEFFPLNAGKLLYGLHDSPEYTEAIERLLTKGRGESMRISAALADSLPEETGQPLLLKRFCAGELTSGCHYLYKRLKPPFDARHVDAIRRGFEGNSAQVAKAAAGLAAKLPLTAELASQLRTYFVQWITKEEPYPKKGGTVPESPRDLLAKILVTFFIEDHDFLIGLAKDDRPDVRTAAREPILRAAAGSSQLRNRLVQEAELDTLEPALLRAVVSAGLYPTEEALGVMRLLQNSTARVRYSALTILDAKFLPLELVRVESTRLLSDPDMDIREAASRALGKLTNPHRALEDNTPTG